MQKIHLALSDLSCQHCVKSVEKTLRAIEGVSDVQVSLTEATISSDLDPQVFIDAIIEAGYQAQLADAK